MRCLGRCAWEAIRPSLLVKGEYSPEKCQALRDYTQRTSTMRALAVCLLTPLPGLIFAIAVDGCFPLTPIADGWNGTPNIALRFLANGWSCAFCMMSVARRIIPELRVARHKIVLAACITSTLYAGFTLMVAALWVFPLPFMTAATGAVFCVMCGLSFVFVVGRHQFRDVQGLGRKLHAYLNQLTILNVLNLFYPAYGAFYRTQHGVMQIVAVLLPIVVKMLAKTLTHRVISSVITADYIPETVLFSVELIHTMFVTTCVQTSADPTRIAMFIFVCDFLPLVWAYREIRRLAMNSKNHHTRVQILPCPPIKSRPKKSESSHSTQRKLTLQPSMPSTDDRFWRQALYATENHLIIEYIECMIPCVYAIYVSALVHLPNVQYYATMDSMQTPGSVERFLTSVGLLLVLQISSVVVFGGMLSRRVLPTVSCLHQLSFVLETQGEMVQLWLFWWVPFCILATVEHGGMDFTLRFDWIRRAQTKT